MFRDPSIGIGGKDGSRLVTMEDYMFNGRKLWLQGRITPDTVDSLLSQLIIIEEDYTFSGIINQTDQNSCDRICVQCCCFGVPCRF